MPIQWILGIIVAYIILNGTATGRLASSKGKHFQDQGLARGSTRYSSGHQKSSEIESPTEQSGASNRLSRFYKKVKSVRLNKLVGATGPWSLELEPGSTLGATQLYNPENPSEQRKSNRLSRFYNKAKSGRFSLELENKF